MPLPSRPPFLPSVLLVLAQGWLLAGCSSPCPTAPPADDAEEPYTLPPSGYPFGDGVDLLNGLPHYSFGEPLAAFPPMRPLPSAPGKLTQGYVLAGPTRWYGPHREQVRGPYCYFRDGNFHRYRVVADADVLRAEALDMFGRGQVQGPHQLLWEGYRARAVYKETPTAGGFEGQLDVVSKPLVDTLVVQPHPARLPADTLP